MRRGQLLAHAFIERVATPAEFNTLIKAEQARWVPVVRRTGIKLG